MCATCAWRACSEFRMVQCLTTLPVNIGDELDSRRIAESVRALYETGLFRDVQLRRDGDTLVIVVAERPTIRRITVTGNKQVKEEELLAGLRDAGLVGRS